MSSEQALKHDFFEIDYDKALEIVHKLHDMRLAYQKFYVSLAGSIIAIAILASHFPPRGGHEQSSNLQAMEAMANIMPVGVMMGFLFLVCSIVGYFVVRNLVSIRRNEVYWVNFAISLRAHIVANLSLPDTYPKLGLSRAVDWMSADFQTIVACSVINFFIAMVGTAFFLDGAKVMQMAFFFGLVAIVFLFVHIQSVRLVASPLERGK